VASVASWHAGILQVTVCAQTPTTGQIIGTLAVTVARRRRNLSDQGVTVRADSTPRADKDELMTTMSPLAATAVRSPRSPRRHYSFGRALAMAPAICGGTLFMLVLTAGLGRWAAPALVLWLSGSALVCTRHGERLAVRAAYRFRRPNAREQQLLEPVWRSALGRCAVAGDRVDWYVQPGRRPNACAAGRRSVAVTEGALRDFLAGRVSERQMQALLAHELGHHATHASRYGLATGWLAAPGRLAFRLVLGIAGTLGGGGRRLGMAVPVLFAVGGTITMIQAIQQRQWLAAAMLLGVAAALIVTPLIDGAVSRASEHAADRYAADAGFGAELAAALRLLGSPMPARRSLRLLLDRHPSVDSRLRRLATPSGGC